MKDLTIVTSKGEFLVMELLVNVKDVEHTDSTRLEHAGKKIKPIEFVSKLTDEHCKDIVEEYGPFGEYKGSVHPSGGSMRFRAYGNPLRAFKCLMDGSKIGFTNGYLFEVVTK